MQNNVCIVMSTYNGEKYIATQLDSVLNQKDVNIIIYIRDDGSNDRTPAIISEYSKEHKNIIYSIEKNIGFKKSFIKALKDAPVCDYYAFCDQDDYWFPSKIKETVDLISKPKSLAFCNAIVSDEFLNDVKPLYDNIVVPSYPESLTSSNTHGFLFCFDKELRDLAIRIPVDRILIPHDFWLITIANLFGNIVFDSNTFVAKYRRLPNSISRIKPIKLFFMRLKSLFISERTVSDYSKMILDYYGNDLDKNIYNLIYACANYRDSIELKKHLLSTENIKLKYKIKILINRF